MLTRSPATRPWPCCTQRHGGLAGEDRAAGRQVGDPGSITQVPDGIDQLEGRAHRSLGVVLVRGRGAPDGHDRVADELLDGAAVPIDDLARRLEPAAQQLAHRLGVARLGDRGRADEVDEQDRDETALGAARRRAGRPAARGRRAAGLGRRGSLRGSPARSSRGRPHSPQNRSPGRFAAPHVGQARASPAPHWAQNFRSGRFSVPQAAQRTRASLLGRERRASCARTAARRSERETEPLRGRRAGYRRLMSASTDRVDTLSHPSRERLLRHPEPVGRRQRPISRDARLQGPRDDQLRVRLEHRQVRHDGDAR